MINHPATHLLPQRLDRIINTTFFPIRPVSVIGRADAGRLLLSSRFFHPCWVSAVVDASTVRMAGIPFSVRTMNVSVIKLIHITKEQYE